MDFLIVKKILLVISIGNVYRTVWRIFSWMARSKGLIVGVFLGVSGTHLLSWVVRGTVGLKCLDNTA